MASNSPHFLSGEIKSRANPTSRDEAPENLPSAVVFPASFAGAQKFSARLTGFQEFGSLPSRTASPIGAVLSWRERPAFVRRHRPGVLERSAGLEIGVMPVARNTWQPSLTLKPASAVRRRTMR